MSIAKEFSVLHKKLNSFDVSQFDEIALEIFHLQAKSVPIYKRYIELLGIESGEIKTVDQIPFLPIQFFKNHEVISQIEKHELTFRSSGTGGNVSNHLVFRKSLYHSSIIDGFTAVFGSLEQYHFLALLPSYLEREDSSLVYMVRHLMQHSGQDKLDFYLHDYAALRRRILELQKSSKKLFLIGVSYALLDFAEVYPKGRSEILVMETGGMKGRRKEMIREELHARIRRGFNCTQVLSEYGMTELLSQAYSLKNGVFKCSDRMTIFIRDVQDPFSHMATGESGAINIIDLSNLYSCSFIATDDLGVKISPNEFRVLGRLDHSDIRGCNLLVVG